MTSSYRTSKNNLKYHEKDVLNRAAIDFFDLGMSPILYLNPGFSGDFTPSKEITIPKFDLSAPHMAVKKFKITETSTTGTSTSYHNSYDGIVNQGLWNERTNYVKISLYYAHKFPTTDYESIDVKIDYLDINGNQIYKDISPAFTIVPENSKLQDISFRYIDLGDAYLKTIVCDFLRSSEVDAFKAISGFSNTSSTIKYRFDVIEQMADDLNFKENWKAGNKMLNNTSIVDFAYQGRDFEDDYLQSDEDSLSHDLFSGNSGDDKIICMRGHDIAHGGEGDDFLGLGNGADIGYGGPGSDVIFGGFGRNTIYNMADTDEDLITFKSDEWASNHIYGNTRGNQNGSKIDNIIGGDAVDKYRIIYDDDVKPVFSYTDNVQVEVLGVSYTGTAIYLDGTLEAHVLNNGNLSGFSHIVDDYKCVEFSFNGL